MQTETAARPRPASLAIMEVWMAAGLSSSFCRSRAAARSCSAAAYERDLAVERDVGSRLNPARGVRDEDQRRHGQNEVDPHELLDTDASSQREVEVRHVVEAGA